MRGAALGRGKVGMGELRDKPLGEGELDSRGDDPAREASHPVQGARGREVPEVHPRREGLELPAFLMDAGIRQGAIRDERRGPGR